MGDEGDSPTKKVGKKKHYPFGTPSHLHPPFSEFAHLPSSTRNFAIALATATDVKPEVIEEAPRALSPSQQQRRRLPTKGGKKKKKKNTGGEGGEDDDEDDEEDEEEEEDDIFSSASGLQPCTKIGCQMVIRAIADIQYRNQIERMDIEDEFDRLTVELQSSEQEIVSSESRLDKLTDIGNQLEIKLNQIMSKVETLEKNKENLQTERTDINTKLMLLEVERQKANRRLEKAQKELTNARWKKKKQAQAQDAESGISFPVSEISESKIIHRDSQFVSKANDIFHTEKNQLARERVVDYIERPPTVKTVPVFLQDKYFNGTGATSAQLDKYAKSHYKGLIEHSLESWSQLEGMCVSSSMDPFQPMKAAHERKIPPKRVTTATLNRLSKSQSLAGMGESGEGFGGLGQHGSMHSISTHTTTTGHRLVGNAGSTAAGGLTRSLSLSMTGERGGSLSPKRSKTSPKKVALQQVNTVHMLEEMHSLLEFTQSTGGTNPANGSRVGSSSSRRRESAATVNTAALSSSGRRGGGGGGGTKASAGGGGSLISRGGASSIRLSPIDHHHGSSGHGQGQSPLALGGSLETMSTTHDDFDSKHQQQQQAEAEKMHAYLEKLAEDGIYADMAFPGLSINDVPVNPNYSPPPKKKLDTVFFKNHEQEHWGRSGPLGKVRTRELQDNQILKAVGHSKPKKSGQDGEDGNVKPKPAMSRSGMILLDTRTLPKTTSRTLTIKHPGMKCFNDSMSSLDSL